MHADPMPNDPMIEAALALHAFDLELCEYVHANIWEHKDTPSFMQGLESDLTVSLLSHLKSEDIFTGDETPEEMKRRRDILFNGDELAFLMMAMECRHEEWRPYPPGHRRHQRTLPHIRKMLGRPVADDWSRKCIHIGKRLGKPGRRLGDGVRIAIEWINLLREIIRNIGLRDLLPRPEGKWPTPSYPGHPPDIRVVIDYWRAAHLGHPDESGQTNDKRAVIESKSPMKQEPLQSATSGSLLRDHAIDFRSVTWDGDEYRFTPGQAACVKILWENWARGAPEVGEETILDAAGLESSRLRDVFSKGNHPAWGRMIVPGSTKGAFQLADQKKSTPPSKTPGSTPDTPGGDS